MANKTKSPKKAAAKSTDKAGKRREFWVGFDLGGTKMLACVLDAENRVLGEARKATGGSEGQAKGRDKILKTIAEAIEEAGVDPRDLQGIGIGCPGLVDPLKGVLLSAPNLGWKQVKLAEMLRRAFAVEVAVLNDVDAGTYGEYVLGAGRGSRSLLGVFPGTGVGAGFVYDGHLIMGRSVSAMELGLIQWPGTHLGSSNWGTVVLEDLTSRLALAAQAGVACYRGQLPQLDRKTSGNLRQIRSKALAQALRGGDEAGMIMFRNSIRFLAMGIANVVNLLAPDRIALGGGLIEEMPKLYLQLLREEVARFALPELTKGLKYAVASLGSHAVAIGSVAWLRQRVSKQGGALQV